MLAKSIAALPEQQARAAKLWSAKPEPWNLLSNGVASGWSHPGGTAKSEWLKQKGGAESSRGFGAATAWGASLLFDSFVDASLLASCKHVNSGSLQNTTVLVLTDYGAIGSVVDDAERLTLADKGNFDYGVASVEEFFRLEHLGRTGCNIVKSVTQLKSMDEVRDRLKRGELSLEECLARKGLLFWNYFPFQRGHESSTDLEGLPDMNEAGWVQLCESFAQKFFKAVDAKQVIWAMRQEVQWARLRHCSSPDRFLSHPMSWSNPFPEL